MFIKELSYRTWTVIDRDQNSPQHSSKIDITVTVYCYHLRCKEWWVSPGWLRIGMENSIGREEGKFCHIFDTVEWLGCNLHC